MDFDALYNAAKAVVAPRRLSDTAECAVVGAALLTAEGNVYVGVNVDTACSMGFCAEHAAAAAMLTHGENHVVQFIAVRWDGKIIAPCGRCREFIAQLHKDNRKALVKVDDDTVLPLDALLPFDWHIPE